MKTLAIFFLLLIFQNCDTKEFPLEVKKIYSSNKEKPFSEFENWNIYLRGGKNDVYVFDYMLNDKIEARYLVTDGEPVMFKRIFPFQDSVFFSLNKDSLHRYSGKSIISKKLYLDFKSLGIDAIFYRPKEKLFLLKKDKVTLVRTVEPQNRLSDSLRVVNYKKIDPHWFYFRDE
ncbi:hypothetical protein [Prolixibacter bellariivorans]|nr:hypothetical protein [Prolixibacter bellariivorans]